MGRLGTACAGQNVNIDRIDAASGQVTFTPVGGPLVIGPSPDSTRPARSTSPSTWWGADTSVGGRPTAEPAQTAQIGNAAVTPQVGLPGSGHPEPL